MEEEGGIDVVDLYSVVGKMCGSPPYETCRYMKRPGDVVSQIGQSVTDWLNNWIDWMAR